MAKQSSVFEGKTLDAAVRKGLEDLGLTRAEVMIRVEEEGSGGFLGIGARPFRVRITPRPGGAIRESGDGRDRDRGRGRGGRGRGRRSGGERGERNGGTRTARAEGQRQSGRRDEQRRERGRGRARRGRGGEGGRGDERRGGEERRERRPRPVEAQPAPQERAPAGHGQEPERGREQGRRRRRRGRRGGTVLEATPLPREAQPLQAEDAMVSEQPVYEEVPMGSVEPDYEEEPMAEPAYAEPQMAGGPPPDEGSMAAGEPQRRGESAGYEDRPRYGDRGGRRDRPMRERERSRDRGDVPSGPEYTSEQLEEAAVKLTREMFTAMGFTAEVTATAEEGRVDVRAGVESDEELLTGRKGEVRQALQHLLNRMLNRGEGGRYHLQLEINDFWSRREEELRGIASDLAEQAIANNAEAVTEYLNAQERRVVHMTLRDDQRVKTYALGTGLIKRVAVAPADFPESEQYDG